jgi:hypothetical protein
MSGFSGSLSVALVESRLFVLVGFLLSVGIGCHGGELRKKNVEISCIRLSCLHDLLGPYYFGLNMGVRKVEK